MDIRSIWSTSEWLHLLSDRQNEEALRSSLIVLLQRSLFQELGMSYTCCRLRKGQPRTRYAMVSDRNTTAEHEQVAMQA